MNGHRFFDEAASIRSKTQELESLINRSKVSGARSSAQSKTRKLNIWGFLSIRTIITIIIHMFIYSSCKDSNILHRIHRNFLRGTTLFIVIRNIECEIKIWKTSKKSVDIKSKNSWKDEKSLAWKHKMNFQSWVSRLTPNFSIVFIIHVASYSLTPARSKIRRCKSECN